MLLPIVAAVLERDLRTLKRQVDAYPDDHSLWQTVAGVSNPGGTLVLHLAGNLQHYLGACLGETGYLRDRPAEFARRDVPRSELHREIDAAGEAVKAALSRLSDRHLMEDFPETVGGVTVQTGDYLVHLATHLAYHLGQIDYHRRALTGTGAVSGAMRPAELGSARPPETL